MKNLSKKGKFFNVNENEESFSSNNNFSFYSTEFNPPHNFIIMNKKRSRIYSRKNMFYKMNKIRKSQNNTNKKLDLIISIIKSKLLGEYDYTVSHYDLCIQSSNKQNTIIQNIDKNKKEDNYYDINDDFDFIQAMKKSPYTAPTNIYKKRVQKINNSFNTSSNFKQILNDFLYQNKNDKSNGEENNDLIINNGIEIDENNNGINNDINTRKSTKEEYNVKEIIKIDNKNNFHNVKTFSEINNMNSLIYNLNKSLKNDLDLNKYKIEANNVTNGNNTNNDINNNINNNPKNDDNLFINNINDINNNNEKEKQNENEQIKIEENKIEENNNIIDIDKIDTININEEINNKDNNENNNENEKDFEKKFDYDNISIQSNISNNSAKKSNQSTASKKIRGFNFRNKIQIRKYSGKCNSSSSKNNNDNNRKG